MRLFCQMCVMPFILFDEYSLWWSHIKVSCQLSFVGTYQ